MTKVQIHKISSYIPKYNTKFVLFSITAAKAAHLRFWLRLHISPVNTQHQSLGFKCRSERRFIQEIWHLTIFVKEIFRYFFEQVLRFRYLYIPDSFLDAFERCFIFVYCRLEDNKTKTVNSFLPEQKKRHTHV